MEMGAIVVAGRELPGRVIRPAHMMPRAYARPYVRCIAQGPIGSHREDGNAAAAMPSAPRGGLGAHAQP